MMENLGKFYNAIPQSYQVALLAALSDQGGEEFFRKYGFHLNNNNITYARKKKDEGDFTPFVISEKNKELKKNRKINSDKKKLEIINYFLEVCEKSSIPLTKNSFFFHFFSIFYLFLHNLKI
jgi:hypothetical protein